MTYKINYNISNKFKLMNKMMNLCKGSIHMRISISIILLWLLTLDKSNTCKDRIIRCMEWITLLMLERIIWLIIILISITVRFSSHKSLIRIIWLLLLILYSSHLKMKYLSKNLKNQKKRKRRNLSLKKKPLLLQKEAEKRGKTQKNEKISLF